VEARPAVAQGSLLASQLARLGSGQLLALADQAAVSATSFLTSLLIGRYAGPSALGIYALGFSIITSCLCVLEALIATPYMVQRHFSPETAGKAGAALAMTAALALATAAVLGCAALVAVGMTEPEAATMLATLAIIAPGVLVREFARRLAFTHLRMGQAVRFDLATSGLQLIALSCLVAADRLSAITAFLSLGATSAAIGLLWLCAAPDDFSLRNVSVRQAARASWSVGRWLFATQIVIAAQAMLIPLLLGWLQDAAAVGIYTACMSIVLFSNPFILGLTNHQGPRSALAWSEGGGERLRRECRQDVILLGAGLLAFCAAILMIGNPLVRMLYGNRLYAGDGAALTVLAFGMLVMAVGMPSNNALTSMQMPRPIFWSGLFATIVTTIGVLLLAGFWGSTGVAVAALIGNVVRTVARWCIFLRATAVVSRGVPRLLELRHRMQQAMRLDPCCEFDVLPLRHGRQADLYLLRAIDNSRPEGWPGDAIVLKQYRPGSRDATPEREYVLISGLRKALEARTRGGWQICVPVPLGASDASGMLWMSPVQGTQLGILIGRAILSLPVAAEIAHAIIEAMAPLWSRGCLHGDLTFDNILVDTATKSLSFLDPGLRSECPFRDHVPTQWSPDAHDLAHFLQDVLCALASHIAHPVAWRRKRRFAEAIVRAYLDRMANSNPAHCFSRDLLTCTRIHIREAREYRRFPLSLYAIFRIWVGLTRTARLAENLRRGRSAQQDPGSALPAMRPGV
jgi:O-antigen/teichoic acid export membrane protein/tRNA A-37 threonylcarbamoyl transferase component Bud32